VKLSVRVPAYVFSLCFLLVPLSVVPSWAQSPDNSFNFTTFVGCDGLQCNSFVSGENSSLALTWGGKDQAGSIFYPSPVDVQSFTTNFNFNVQPQSDPADPVADGFTFTIQNEGPTALGGIGGSLGYAGIGKSVAIKFDIFKNSDDPSDNSTGIFVDGALPIGPGSIDLTDSNINLHSGDEIGAYITYDGTTLNLTLVDLKTFARWSHCFVINIPATVGNNAAYVGFTGSSGSVTGVPIIDSWNYQAGSPLSYPEGFSSDSSISRNGSASLSGTALQLTDHSESSAAGSAFYTTPVNVASFTTHFNFQLTDANADGFTFTIQNDNPTELGAVGGSVGYVGIGNSVAVKFDLYQNKGDPSNNSIGLLVNGVPPLYAPQSIDLTGTGIDLHSGHKMGATITYSLSADVFTSYILRVKITDLVTSASWSHSFKGLPIPDSIGGNTAYVGFTGATGGETSTQQILNWTFE